MLAPVLIAGAAGAAALTWGWYEAGWVRLRGLELELPRLPPGLDGLRVVHLSDFHLGVPSRGERATERAVDWAAERNPDLVLVTGDLLSRPRGEERLRALVGRLPRCYAILGNHDVALSRDPFAKGERVSDLGPVTLLGDDAVALELRGKRILIAGLDPVSRGREPDLWADADLRILLSHFPSVLDRLPAGRWDLVLAGHMHDGQICLPYPGGKVRLAHPRARYVNGVYRRDGSTMHVSAGLGTTFVPFRFFARPEATELTLRSTGAWKATP